MPNGWHRKTQGTPAERARKKQYNSTEYKRAKQAGQRAIDEGRGYCWRCGTHIPFGTPRNGWHLGHDDYDRSIIRGVECIPCNLGAAARKGNAMLDAQPTGPIERRSCVICATSYQPNHHRQRCCSPNCRATLDQQLALRQPRKPTPDTQRDCTECGTTFWTHGTNRLTCSKPCLRARTARRLREDPDLRERYAEKQRQARRRWKDKQATARTATRTW